MDIHQLKTFVTVAREGSITRAAQLLHLSQPAVSAHIKAMEDTFEVALFERTARGMSLTAEGRRLLDKAERTLSVHQDMMDEVTRIKARLAGKLRIGAGSNTDHAALGKLLLLLAQRCPDVEVVVKHGTSAEVIGGLRAGTLDGGFYNEGGEPDPELATVEVAELGIDLVAAPGVVSASERPDWGALSGLAWIFPAASACCGRAAESLFRAHRFRPTRVVSVDRESVTRSLVAGGLGVGLLHSETSAEASRRGEVEVLVASTAKARVLFAHLASRAQDPLIAAAVSLLPSCRRVTPSRTE